MKQQMTKHSIVLQLQSDILNKEASLCDLLRKAFLIATKLDIQENILWIKKELEGYVFSDTIPPYRLIHGVLKVIVNLLNLKKTNTKNYLVK